MKKLLQKIGHFGIKEALEIEREDLQFIALEQLYRKIKNKDIYFSLVLGNATIGYMLSGTGEQYWNEFAQYFSYHTPNHLQDIPNEISGFLKASQYNKRLHIHKMQRIQKIAPFIYQMPLYQNILLQNIEDFHQHLAAHMSQPKNAKTITFSIKMLLYAIRIHTKQEIIAPKTIQIPIDSRLTKIYFKYNTNKKLDIRSFYTQLSVHLNIPPIHLDGILWTKYKELI